MNYIKYQDKKIAKISVGYQNWYKARSNIWGERYMKEKEDVLTAKRNKKETSIIIKYLPKNCKKIFDAPCGYGRISNNLATLGYNVTGIDINSYFINLAKKQAGQKKLSASYVVSDILEKKIPGRFDAVLNIFTSLGYFENEKKNELFIKRLCQYVKIGGRLIIEIINPIAITKNYKKKGKTTLRDGTNLYFNRYLDLRTSTNITEIRSDKQKRIIHIIRLYYPHELANICRKFGCELIEILDQDGKAKDIKNSPRIWLIFQKK